MYTSVIFNNRQYEKYHNKFLIIGYIIPIIIGIIAFILQKTITMQSTLAEKFFKFKLVGLFGGRNTDPVFWKNQRFLKRE